MTWLYAYCLTISAEDTATQIMRTMVTVRIPELITSPNGVALALGAAGQIVGIPADRLVIDNVIDFGLMPAES